MEQFEAFHDEKRWTVTLAETGALTLTAERIKRIARYLDGDRFMVTYGDGVADVDVRALVEFHRAQGRLATVTGVSPQTRFGELRTDGDRVVEFLEKPRLVGRVNGGFFVFERAVLDYLDDGPLEHSPLERLAREGQLSVFRHDGYWAAMDTIREKRVLEAEWATGRAQWKVW